MLVEYSSNNSGGSWWLKDEQWKALEDAGWDVEWGGTWYCNSAFNFRNTERPSHVAECPADVECKGHNVAANYEAAKENRWLGSVACEAIKEFESMFDAIREWEKVTGESASDEGCNCCGAPHNFSANSEHVSGDECARALIPNSPTTYRDALEEIERLRATQ